MRVSLGQIHRVNPPPFRLRRRSNLGDAASDCAGGNAAACATYYSTTYAQAPSVVAAATQPGPSAGAQPGYQLDTALYAFNPISAVPGQPLAPPAVTAAVTEDVQNGITPFTPGSASDKALFVAGLPTAGNYKLVSGTPVLVPYGTPGGNLNPVAGQTQPPKPTITVAPAPVTVPKVSTSQTGTGPPPGPQPTNVGTQQTQSTSFDVKTFLTNSLIGGLPNWALLLGGAGVVWFLAKRH